MLPERVVDKIDARGDCWLWMAYTTPKGYGQTWTGERVTSSHRFVWETLVGPIPEGMVLDHWCEVPRCCNPDHLQVTTDRENVLRTGPAKTRRRYCPQGHDTQDVGRTLIGMCRECFNATNRALYRRKREANR